MAPSSSSPAASQDSVRGKRKRESSSADAGEQGASQWRAARAQETYASKLVDSLRLVRAGVPARGPREVRDAADRALAAAARGRSRWSRAILARRRRRRSATLLRARAPVVPAPAPAPSAQPKAVARKAKVLGRLVPGCRKLPFPALLAEVSDYIAALEMQVRAMSAVEQALSSVSASSGGSPPPA